MKRIFRVLLEFIKILRLFIYAAIFIVFAILFFVVNSIKTYDELSKSDKEEILIAYDLTLEPNQYIEKLQLMSNAGHTYYVITVNNVKDIDYFMQDNTHLFYAGKLDKSFSLFRTTKYNPKPSYEYTVYIDGTQVYISCYSNRNKNINEILGKIIRKYR